jgi:hypothetical protein
VTHIQGSGTGTPHKVNDQSRYLRLGGHVKTRRRLIENQQLRFARSCDRQRDSLLLPTGKLVRIAPEGAACILDTHFFKELDCASLPRFAFETQAAAERLA